VSPLRGLRSILISNRGLSPPATFCRRCAAEYGLRAAFACAVTFLVRSSTQYLLPGATMAGTYTKLFYHIVFSTKHRQNFISTSVEEELHKYMAGIVRGVDGQCVAINGMPDHILLLVILPPKIAVSDALRIIKSNSSKWVHETHPKLQQFSWQDGFSAFTVSKSNAEPVRQYIRDQKTHHMQSDYKAELIGLLKKHDVEYDDRYIWD
jgi:putative transposase